MKIGFDFWNVITQFPEQTKQMARAFLLGGHDVYIISAVGDRSLKKYNTGIEGYKTYIESYGVPHLAVHVLYFDADEKIPEQKLKKCKELGIDVFIDDRPSTIKLLHENGIVAMQMPKPLKSPTPTNP